MKGKIAQTWVWTIIKAKRFTRKGLNYFRVSVSACQVSAGPCVCVSPPVLFTAWLALRCTYCNKLHIGETGRRLGDRFREHLRDVKRNDQDVYKPVARHLNLPSHSKQHMAVCGLSLHLGSSESRKTLEQKFIFQIGTLNPHRINERFSFN